MHIRRLLCTSSHPLQSLKPHLRRLYKTIHPDLFSQHPIARSTNEQSFAILQSSVQRLFDRHDPSPSNLTPPTAPSNKPQMLTFFSYGPQTGDLRKCTVHFSEREVEKSLHAVFEALELPKPPGEVLKDEEEITLRETVRRARGVVPEGQGIGEMEMERVIVLGLRRRFGVYLKVEEGIDGVIGVLKGLGRMLEGFEEGGMRGLVVEVHGGEGVSVETGGVGEGRNPRVELGVKSGWDEWEGGLEMGREGCCVWRRVKNKVERLEEEVAGRIGVRVVLMELEIDETGLMGRYEERLRELRGGKKMKGVENVAIMVGADMGVDLDRGVVRVDMNKDGEEIRKWLERNAEWVDKEYVRRRNERECVEKERERVRRLLKVEDVRKGDVKIEEFRHGLQRLENNAKELCAMMDGVGIVIGNKLRVMKSGYVEIPWDMDEVKD